MRVSVLLPILLACGEKKSAPESPPPTPAPNQAPVDAVTPDAFAAWPATLEDRPLALEWHSMKTSLTVRVPVGWVNRGPNERSGTYTIPTDNPSPMQPSISYSFGNRSCSGVCDATDIKKNVAEMWAAVEKSWGTYGTGSPDLEAVKFDVKVLEKGAFPDGSFKAAKITRPAGSPVPAYMDRLQGVCERFRKTDDFYIHVTIIAPLEYETTLWPLLLEACKTPWFR
jgi:hypothetical protein